MNRASDSGYADGFADGYARGLKDAQADADSRIERSIRVLQKNYNLALSRDYIQNPIAWALYETWKEFDR